jgi:hypothetical protein
VFLIAGYSVTLTLLNNLARTRTYTNPDVTEANAAGRSARARVARESKREESRGVDGREALDQWAGRDATKYMYDI